METRKYDILDIRERRKKAKTSWERNLLDRTMKKIFKENTPRVEKLRKKLIQAVRGNSKRAINRYTEEILREPKYE